MLVMWHMVPGGTVVVVGIFTAVPVPGTTGSSLRYRTWYLVYWNIQARGAGYRAFNAELTIFGCKIADADKTACETRCSLFICTVRVLCSMLPFHKTHR